MTTTTFTMTYTSGATTHLLNGYDVATNYTFHLLGFNDVGIPGVERITQRGAFQHGDTNVDFRLQPRTITLSGMVYASTTHEHMLVRSMLGKLFKVSNIPSQLRLTSTDGATVVDRQIDVLVNGGINISSDTVNGYDVFFEVELRADDPLWYDPNEQVVYLTGTSIGNPTDIPAVIPRTYGTNGVDSSTNIAYEGTFVAYPIIEIFSGDAGLSNLTIANVTSNQLILITSIPVNTTYTIDLRYGLKTVVDQNGVNRIQSVNPQSNLTTWSIIPGDAYGSYANNIVVESNNASTNSSVTLRYFTQYTAI